MENEAEKDRNEIIYENNIRAFPSTEPIGQHGMTLRDYFAAKAMQSLLMHEPFSSKAIHFCATKAYDVAEAMLLERDNR